MKRGSSITRMSKRSFIIALALLMITHIIMGVVLITMSKNALRKQIEQRMLDIAGNRTVHVLSRTAARGKRRCPVVV